MRNDNIHLYISRSNTFSGCICALAFCRNQNGNEGVLAMMVVFGLFFVCCIGFYTEIKLRHFFIADVFIIDFCLLSNNSVGFDYTYLFL